MDQHPSASPEQARKFAPKDQPHADPTDEAGRALIAMLEQAASLAHENCKGPTELASKIVRDLRAAEERIKELDGRGAQPVWLRDKLKAGAKLEVFAVDKSAAPRKKSVKKRRKARRKR